MTRLLPLLLLAVVAGSPAALHSVGPGEWRPLYPAEGEQSLPVDGFQLEERPVTNAEYLAFVKKQPSWQRGQVPALFSDDGYLSHWTGALEPKPDDLARPVTHVSWWAARAFCEARGRRLPYEAEWELAAMASATKKDATSDPAYLAQILAWYGRPGSAALPNAGDGEANAWGVRDLHGVVWEWVEDFQSALVTADNRENGAVDISKFCGAGAVSAEVKEDYAAFMRLAFRASLAAQYTTRNLGFRCAMSIEEK